MEQVDPRGLADASGPSEGCGASALAEELNDADHRRACFRSEKVGGLTGTSRGGNLSLRSLGYLNFDRHSKGIDSARRCGGAFLLFYCGPAMGCVFLTECPVL